MSVKGATGYITACDQNLEVILISLILLGPAGKPKYALTIADGRKKCKLMMLPKDKACNWYSVTSAYIPTQLFLAKKQLDKLIVKESQFGPTI